MPLRARLAANVLHCSRHRIGQLILSVRRISSVLHGALTHLQQLQTIRPSTSSAIFYGAPPVRLRQRGPLSCHSESSARN